MCAPHVYATPLLYLGTTLGGPLLSNPTEPEATRKWNIRPTFVLVRLSYRQRLITLLVICIPRADYTTATIKPQKGNRVHFSPHAQAGWGPTRGLRFLFLYLTPGRRPKHPRQKR